MRSAYFVHSEHVSPFCESAHGARRIPHLRVIRLGGEQIFPHDFELYRQHFPRGCVLVGAFASTETGPVTIYVMDHDSRHRRRRYRPAIRWTARP